MKKGGPACLLPLLALAALSPYPVRTGLATPSPAKEEWRAIRSPHFELVSQAGAAPAGGAKRPPAKQAYPRELPEIKRETPKPPLVPAEPPRYGFVRGRVAKVSCKFGQDSHRPAIVLSVQAKSRIFRFFKEDLSRIAMISGPEEGSICESVGRTASVNYLERRQGGFDGEIMSFEFAAKEKPPVEPMKARTAGSPRRAAAPRPKLSAFRGTVEEVSCARPMVFTLRGKDRSGKIKLMKLRAASATEFFAIATQGSPPASFNACESKGLAARATFRPSPPGDPYDGELTRLDFDWSRK